MSAPRSTARRRAAAIARWATKRHRSLEALLCAACLVAGVAIEHGGGAALVTLGGLFAVDLGAEAAGKYFALALSNRRARR